MLATPGRCSRAEYGELMCAGGAAAFVATGCWMGFVIAFNGVLTHTLQSRWKYAPHLVTCDVLCNTFLALVMLSVREYWPVSFVLACVVVGGMSVSNCAISTRPFLARVAHILLVQVPSFVAVSVWCDCCS